MLVRYVNVRVWSVIDCIVSGVCVLVYLCAEFRPLQMQALVSDLPKCAEAPLTVFLLDNTLHYVLYVQVA